MRAVIAAALLVTAILQQSSAINEVGVVHLDFVVTDGRGHLVETLERADIEVTENGRALPIDDLRFIKIDGPASALRDPEPPIRSEFDEQEQAARPGTRLFALFLDEYHVSGGASTLRVREMMSRFVTREIGPRDLVTVMKPLDSLLTIRMTRDRDVVLRAIDSFEGRKGDYTPRDAFERDVVAGAAWRVEQMREQVTISALNALAVHLGILGEDRKTLVFVGGEFGQPPRQRGLEWLPTPEAVVRSANRGNVAIYAVDPGEPLSPDAEGRAAEAAGTAPAADMLEWLTGETDGQIIAGTTNIDDRLHRIAADASAYYLLTYRSVHPADGQFRAVEVRVKRKGVRVRARKGYWALSPDEVLAAKILTASAPSRPVGFDLPWRRSPLVSPWFGIERGDAGKTRVTFVWEPVAAVPGDRSRRTEPWRIELTALGPDGAQAFAGPVLAAAPRGEAGTAPSRAVFDVQPGRLSLKMMIEDVAGKAIDSDVREISIRGLSAAVALGTPQVLRARTEVEFRALAADPDSVPTAVRVFRRTEHLIVRLCAYAPEEPPRVSARLLTRFGQQMRDLPVAAAVAPRPSQFDLRLASLPPGEYVIEITVSSTAGQAKDLFGFRVTS
jgi:VWFA-related protein